MFTMYFPGYNNEKITGRAFTGLGFIHILNVYPFFPGYNDEKITGRAFTGLGRSLGEGGARCFVDTAFPKCLRPKRNGGNSSNLIGRKG